MWMVPPIFSSKRMFLVGVWISELVPMAISPKYRLPSMANASSSAD